MVSVLIINRLWLWQIVQVDQRLTIEVHARRFGDRLVDRSELSKSVREKQKWNNFHFVTLFDQIAQIYTRIYETVC